MPSWTTPHTWATDEVISASNLNTEVRDNPQYLYDNLGSPARATATADSSTFTTGETTLLTLNVTVPAGGRDLRVFGQVQLQSTVANDVVEVRIKEGGTTLKFARLNIDQATTPQDAGEFSAFLTAPASGAHTYTMTALRQAGTGTITAKASSTNPMYLCSQVI